MVKRVSIATVGKRASKPTQPKTWSPQPFLRTLGALSFVSVIAATGCKPELEGRPSLVDSPRVIGIRSTAAEAKAESDVTYDVLVAQPVDDSTAPEFNWALCLARKPLATAGPIADTCLTVSGPELQSLGGTSSVSGSIPKDACTLFGPNPPSQKAGDPAVRPVDPDTTGGYYQPVRLLTQYGPDNSQYDVGVTRLSCGLAGGATQEQSATFTKDYRPNQNPQISQISFKQGGADPIVVDPNATDLPTVPGGANLSFEVSWPDCPLSPTCGDNICSAGEDLTNCPSDCQNPQGCEGSEPYLSYDTVTQSLADRRESIRVSWYATDGNFDHDRTGRAEDEAASTDTSNNWSAPDKATKVRFWLVIRDDRRGVSWTTFDLNVIK